MQVKHLMRISTNKISSYNKHFSKIENNECTNCNAGEELKTIEGEDRVVTCEACKSGHISLAGMESCIACPPGKKKNTSKQFKVFVVAPDSIWLYIFYESHL